MSGNILLMGLQLEDIQHRTPLIPLVVNKMVGVLAFLEKREIESTDLTGSSTKQPGSVWSGWTGNSLEGSAVQEPDPLDMSEEAKAQRFVVSKRKTPLERRLTFLQYRRNLPVVS
ncbi:hypothetical protein Vadar_032281 [Vaccinium darrowii]|uniref:Uncharacterized protein n=1 Tax=Vaccinium darrowii TaxID=229202 RepID=A0ACB7YBR5_9ERIC|nr:hypothetical protein Vadar_032281 [Vaccinium darrowii]